MSVDVPHAVSRRLPTDGVVAALTAVFLLASALTYTSVSRVVVYPLLGLSLLGLVALRVLDNPRFEIPVPVVLAVFGLGLVMGFHLIRLRTVFQLTRMPVFIAVLGICLVVVPRQLPPTRFLSLLSRVSALVVVVGVPAELIGTYAIGGLTMAIGRHGGMASFMGNPNGLGLLAAFGAVSGCAVAMSRGTRRARTLELAIVGVNVLGVVLSQGRLAAALLVGGIGLFCWGCLFGSRAQMMAAGAGVVLLALVLSMRLGILPGPSAIRSIYLGRRPALWAATLAAIAERPLLGHGYGRAVATLAPHITGFPVKGPHSAYLYQALSTGVLGLLALLSLLVFFARALFWRDDLNPAFGALFVMVVVAMLIESIVPLGVGILPVVPQLVFGYIIRPRSNPVSSLGHRAGPRRPALGAQVTVDRATLLRNIGRW